MATGSLFGSFFLGGFEGSTMKLADGRRVDVSRANGHVAHAAEDYAMLADAGIRCVRESLAWHRIEREPGHYDWSEVRSMQRAAAKAGTRIVWDLCHYGWPDHLGFWSDTFIDRLADFAMNYYEDFVRPNKQFRPPSDQERAAMADLVARLRALPDGADAEAIQNEVFAVGKDAGFDPLRAWFQALYEVLLGQSQGPRFGSFAAIFGLDRTIALIEEKLA